MNCLIQLDIHVEIMENLQTKIDDICPQSCNRQNESRDISGICMLAWGDVIYVVKLPK